jgi:hypothetical protein
MENIYSAANRGEREVSNNAAHSISDSVIQRVGVTELQFMSFVRFVVMSCFLKDVNH